MDALKCPLCGLEFNREDAGCAGCSSCPMAGKGHLVCCPRCGYQVIGRSDILDFLGALWRLVRKGGRGAA